MKLGQLMTGLTYLSVGLVHTLARKPLAAIVPDYLPAHRELVVISGWAGSLGGAGLLVPRLRRPAAWGLVVWLVAVYPANVWMVQRRKRYALVPAWMLWARLPFQIPMIWWTWRYTRSDQQLGA